MGSAKTASNQAYIDANTKQIKARFYPTDMALYDFVKSQPEGIAPYIKRLIREDMERKGVAFEPVPARNPHWAKQKDGGSEC